MTWHPGSPTSSPIVRKVITSKLEGSRKFIKCSCSRSCMNISPLSKIINKWEDKQKVIRAFKKRRSISYLCVRPRISLRDHQITAWRKNTHRPRKKRKAKSHRYRRTNRHGGGSMFMTLLSHLDHFYTHTYRTRRNMHTCCGPHTAQQICLKARSCVYHSLHPAHRNICEQAVFFFSVFSVCICICRYLHTVHAHLLNHLKLTGVVFFCFISACRQNEIKSSKSKYKLEL